jgi:hypothetical protein
MAIELSARSIELPTGEESSYRPAEIVSEREQEWSGSKRSRESYFGGDGDGPIPLPTSVAEDLLDEIARRTHTSRGLSQAMRASLASLLASKEESLLAACLLQVSLLRNSAAWQLEDKRFLQESAETFLQSNWVVVWMAAQLELVELRDAVRLVPWHAILLNQRLILTEKVRFNGPKFFGADISTVLSSEDGEHMLSAIGRRLVEEMDAEHSRWYGLSPKHVAADFVFYYPSISLEPIERIDRWADEQLVGFSVVAKAACLSWPNGHAIGELVNESERPVLAEIATAAVGWGLPSDEVLAEVAEPCRAAIKLVLNPSWPFALVPI